MSAYLKQYKLGELVSLRPGKHIFTVDEQAGTFTAEHEDDFDRRLHQGCKPEPTPRRQAIIARLAKLMFWRG